MVILERPWRSLQVSDNFPLLLLKARLDDRGCSFHLTDLNRLWGMFLNRSQVIIGAQDQSTSIDPSEDDEQYEQFITKVYNSLNGDTKTALCLKPGSEQDWLQLCLSASLPGSLPTFRWRVELRRLDGESSGVFASDLLVPLIAYASSLKSQVHQLIEELGHKDRVISKITDKLEISGNDLSQVFPGVSNIKISRKSSQRSQLASHIDGLSTFDEKAWRARVTANTNHTGPSLLELNDILADLPALRFLSSHNNSAGAWWRSIEQENVGDGLESAGQELCNPRQSSVPRLPAEGINLRAEELRRQISPSQNQPLLSATSQDTEDEGTEDDVDRRSEAKAGLQRSASGRIPLQSKKDSRSQARARARARPKNDLMPKYSAGSGGDQMAHTSPTETDTETDVESPQSPARHKGAIISLEMGTPKGHHVEVLASQLATSPSKLGAFGSKRTSKSPESELAPGMAKLSPRNRKARLGTFGGKSKASSPELESQAPKPTRSDDNTRAPGLTEDDVPNPGEGEASTKKAGKLGRFVGKTVEKHTCETIPTQQDRWPRPPERPDEVMSPRENSEERANRQREKLKRELEDKAKAAVKKKKRKF